MLCALRNFQFRSYMLLPVATFYDNVAEGNSIGLRNLKFRRATPEVTAESLSKPSRFFNFGTAMDPIDNTENYIWGVFYFNRSDSRIIVSKRMRYLGWTFNFARVETYLLLFIILSISFLIYSL